MKGSADPRFRMLREAPRSLLAGALLLLVIALLCLFAPLVTRFDPNAIDLFARLEPPSLAHPLGTDEIGRDLLSRLLYGGRHSLVAGSSVVLIGSMTGALVGGTVGFVGGAVEAVVMRLADALMALPGLVIALALTAVIGPSLINAVLTLGLLSSPLYLRLARAETLIVRKSGYVAATRLLGGGLGLQLRRNVLPNIAPMIAVYAALNLGTAILAIASLSFIGLGAQPPLPEWGAMVNEGRSYLTEQYWYSAAPGAAVALTALASNLMADGLRDLLDPRSARRS